MIIAKVANRTPMTTTNSMIAWPARRRGIIRDVLTVLSIIVTPLRKELQSMELLANPVLVTYPSMFAQKNKKIYAELMNGIECRVSSVADLWVAGEARLSDLF